MFSVQTVPGAEDEVHPVDVQCANETQSVSEMTSHDLGGDTIGQDEGHSLEQVKTDATSVQGSYVSLLADIATIEQNDGGYSDQQMSHDMPSTVDYATSTFTGQEQIQALADTDLSSTLQNENLVSYQPVQNQNIGYSLNNSGGNTHSLPHYVIIQPIVSSFFNDNSASDSSTLIHLPNAADNQLNLDSNKELEDAVANITEKAVLDTEEHPNNEVSPEKSFLVSTNSRGEVRDIQVVRGDQKAVLAVGEADLSVYRRKSQLKCVKSKHKKTSLSTRKEYSSHLKKFSLDDLNSSGKTKKEVFEEYLEKSKVKNDAKDKVNDKAANNDNDKMNFTNEQNGVEVGNVKDKTDYPEADLQVQNDRELVFSKLSHTNEGKAESGLDSLEENKYHNCDNESVSLNVIEHLAEPMHKSQGALVKAKAKNSCGKEDDSQVLSEPKDVDTIKTGKTHRDVIGKVQVAKRKTTRQEMNKKSVTHAKRTRQQLKDIKANIPVGKDSSVQDKRVSFKRKKQMPHDLRKNCKVAKFIESCEKIEYNKIDSHDDNIESRVLEDFCRFFKSEDKCILHLEPITLKLINPKELLVIEMEVENELQLGSVEKGVSENGFTKYYLNLSIPEQVDEKSYHKKYPEPKQLKLEKSYSKGKKKKWKSMKNKKIKLNKETSKDQIPISDKETVSDNVISSLKEDGTGNMNTFDDVENLENEINLSDTDLLDTHEEAQFDSEEITSNSKTQNDGSGTNAETDIGDKRTAYTAAKPKRKKGCRLAEQEKLEQEKSEQKKSEEEKSSIKDSQEDSSQKNYTVVVSEEGIRMYTCPVCGYMSKYPSNAKKHIYEHTARKDWICEMCGMSFKSNNSLQKHKIVHQKDRPFPCPLCPQKFKRKRMYRCELCGKEMSIRQNMDVHVNQHTGRRPWQCEVCGLRFKGPSNLRAHMHQHEEEMRFSCAICFRKFRDRGTYRQHLKRHLGEKKHVCEHCGKSFVISSDLKKHIRTHTGEKPFKCSVCEQQFSDGSSLVRHEKMHAAKYRYECTVCRRQYSRKDLCKKHINKAHPDLGPVEVNQVSIEDNRQMPRDMIKTARNQDSHANKMQRGSRKSLNREATPSTRIKKLKKSWQTLTEEASKRYKEHSGASQYGEYPQPVGPTFSIIDFQSVPTLYGNMNQKFTDQKPQVPGFGTQDMMTSQGPVVYQSYVSEPGRF